MICLMTGFNQRSYIDQLYYNLHMWYVEENMTRPTASLSICNNYVRSRAGKMDISRSCDFPRLWALHNKYKLWS